MSKIHWQLAEKFRSHWIKVKFYEKQPKSKEAKRLNNVRFCEATQQAILSPVLLSKGSISCPGANYVFGWNGKDTEELLTTCTEKMQTSRKIIESMWQRIPHLPQPFNYIGLNTAGEPDLVISYMLPEQVMRLMKIYHRYRGENLDVSLCSMMSICGGVGVRTYLTNQISLSFGCEDSRKFAKIGRSRLAVGIPKQLFRIFAE